MKSKLFKGNSLKNKKHRKNNKYFLQCPICHQLNKASMSHVMFAFCKNKCNIEYGYSTSLPHKMIDLEIRKDGITVHIDYKLEKSCIIIATLISYKLIDIDYIIPIDFFNLKKFFDKIKTYMIFQ